MSAVKYFTMIECQAHQDVLQLSYENEHEGQFASYKTTFRTATEEWLYTESCESATSNQAEKQRQRLLFWTLLFLKR